MNAALLKARQRAQAAFERDYGGSFTISGTTYTGAVHLDPVVRMLNESGNWENRQILHASVLKTQMPVQPERGALIIFGEHTYRVHGEMGGQNAIDVAWQITASRKLPSPS